MKLARIKGKLVVSGDGRATVQGYPITNELLSKAFDGLTEKDRCTLLIEAVHGIESYVFNRESMLYKYQHLTRQHGGNGVAAYRQEAMEWAAEFDFPLKWVYFDKKVTILIPLPRFSKRDPNDKKKVDEWLSVRITDVCRHMSDAAALHFFALQSVKSREFCEANNWWLGRGG